MLWLLILIGVLAYASSMVVNRLYDKMENKDGSETETEEADDGEELPMGRITKHLIDTSKINADEGDTEHDDARE